MADHQGGQRHPNTTGEDAAPIPNVGGERTAGGGVRELGFPELHKAATDLDASGSDWVAAAGHAGTRTDWFWQKCSVPPAAHCAPVKNAEDRL